MRGETGDKGETGLSGLWRAGLKGDKGFRGKEGIDAQCGGKQCLPRLWPHLSCTDRAGWFNMQELSYYIILIYYIFIWVGTRWQVNTRGTILYTILLVRIYH